MSADGHAAQAVEPTPEPEVSVKDKAAPSMSALLAAGQAAHAVCTPPAAPGERPDERDGPGQRDAA